jgi:flagellar basal body-associated protein FliL
MSVPTANEPQPKSRKWLIVVVAVVVFCCLCSLCMVLFWYLYTYGDKLFSLAASLAPALM